MKAATKKTTCNICIYVVPSAIVMSLMIMVMKGEAVPDCN